MRIILSQGRRICSELSRLEQSNQMDQNELSQDDGDIERCQLALLELSKVSALNEQLHSEETKCHILEANLNSIMAKKKTNEGQSAIQQSQGLSEVEMNTLEQLRLQNEKTHAEINRNKKLISQMQDDCKVKKESIKRLEYDVNVIEKEWRKLGKEFDKVMKIEIPAQDESTEESNLLSEAQAIYTELKELQLGCEIQTTESVRLSPESTSGISSGAEGGESGALNESSYYIESGIYNLEEASFVCSSSSDRSTTSTLKFSDESTLTPAGSNGSKMEKRSTVSLQDLRSIGKTTPKCKDKNDYFIAKIAKFQKNSGIASPSVNKDEDLNSDDTGLSSLHSSSDEAAMFDFGTLV